MRKHFLVLFLAFSLTAAAQTRGVKIGYIDMEYILQNVPDYAEAKNQLEQKAVKWKQEIETKKTEIDKLKEALKTEKVLLTKELIEEREEEIRFQETELADYQEKRFGPTGDLVVQKAVLVKPIQDQVFTAVQDIAEAKKYDFIFDKSSDLTMLFSAKRHDVSEQVLRVLKRSANRSQLNKKQLKEEEERENKEDAIDENPELQARQKALEDKRLAREKALEDRKLAAEQKKADFEARRKQLREEAEAKRKGGKTTTNTSAKEGEDKAVPAEEVPVSASDSTAVDPKKAALEERARKLEERKQALDEKRAKAAADREAAKKAREEKKSEGTKPEETTPAEE